MNENVFAKIPNSILSINTGKKNKNGYYIYTNKNSMFNITKDDKIIKVIYELMVGTNFRDICKTSINDLIELCSYPINKSNQKSFKELLFKLHTHNFITIQQDKFSPKDIISIDTDELFNATNNGYTIIEQKEIDIINNKFSDNRERNTLLKGYFFIKSMVHKREDNSMIALNFNCESQTKIMDYKYINTFTGINNISKCIKTLKENELINYANFLEYPIGKPKQKMDAKNIYVVRALECNWDIDLMNEELKIGLSQYKEREKENGFEIITQYKNNNKSENGLKGSLIKKLNLGTITENELNVLNNIVKKNKISFVDKYQADMERLFG